MTIAQEDVALLVRLTIFHAAQENSQNPKEDHWKFCQAKFKGMYEELPKGWVEEKRGGGGVANLKTLYRRDMDALWNSTCNMIYWLMWQHQVSGHVIFVSPSDLFS